MKKISVSVLIGALLFMIFSGAANILAADATIPTEKDLRLFEWRSIGPYTFSGRITDFAVPKGQSQVYYVATATGGIWKTEDSGIHFEPIFDEYGNMSMGNITVAPSAPDIVYAATGEALHARSSAHGNGMWKSTNGGRTWKHIGLEESYFIPKIAVDSENPDIVYVAAEGKLYDNKMDCQRGLYKTTDGGEHWEQVLDLKDRGVGDFVIDPNNSDIVIAIAYKTYRRTWTFIDRQPGNHVYKSIDGGKSWKKLTNGLPLDIKTGWNGICMYPKDPNIVYIRMDEEVNLGFAEGEDSYLFREGRVFKDDFYFNKFKHYEINSKIMKLIEFEPIAAEDEEELVEQLNEYIKDKDFINRLKVNIEEFNSKARRVYRRNKDIIETIDEIEKTLKRDREEQLEYEKVNRFILAVLLKDSEGVEIKENRINIVDPEKVQIHPEFKKLVKFSPKGIKNVKELAQNIEEFVKDRELRDKLGLEFKDFNKQARKIYKDNEEVLNQLEEVKKKIRKFKNTEGRYQTMNRYILQILYADSLQKMEPVKKAGVIYKSEDQGETWTRQTEYKLVGGSQVVNQIEAGYSGRIEIDPNDSDKLYAVEVIVKISKDGGKTFKNASWIGTHKCHVDTRGMWIDPLNSDHILNGNDGGVSETWDGGKHWSQKETISAQQFYDISVDNQLPYNVMGGTQDNGCWIGPSRNRNSNGVFPADWTYLPSGDGFYVVRNWWNPEYIYFESQFGWSRRMNFKAGEMISLSKRNSDEERAAGKPPQRYQWDSPIILSPHNPGIVYVCSQHVHRSLTRGDRETFVTISPDLSKNNKERIELSKKTNLQYATIYTFAESPVKPGVYWAGTDDGNLQLSTNGGNTWQNITEQFYNEDGTPKKGIEGDRIPYDRWVMRVTPSAHDPKTCYVAYSGYRTHNEDNTYIYVTHDLGKTWKDLSNGMMNPVNDIEEDPDNSNVLYLATDYGVFVSIDKGENWVDMSASAPDVIMMDIDIQERERDLAVATYGRGFYIVDIYPFKDFGEEVFQKDAYLFDIQRVIKWNMLERRGAQYGEFAKVKNPPIGASIYYYIKQPVKSAFIVIKDLEGNEIQKRNVKAVKGIHSYFWNLRKQLEDDDNARSWRRGAIVEPGTFTVSLVIDDKEVETKKLKVLEDTLK
ncbi:MAG: VPS10 domain-containing protein [Candidatus Aminicenantaceae bacterium]